MAKDMAESVISASSVHKRIIRMMVGLLFAFGLALPALVEAASLYFVPSSGSYHRDENFTVGVLVNAEVPINAVQATITFPTEYLEAVALERSGINSIIDLWVERPSFSNAGEVGNVRFEGVALNPGFVGSDGKIIDIVFRVRKSGGAELQFTDFAILANDGFGTNVATPASSAQFTLLPARSLPPPAQAPRQDLKAVAEKIGALEERIESLVPVPAESGILKAWNILPQWIRLSILVLIGVATLILGFIIVSLGIIVLIWLWSHAWYRRYDFLLLLETPLRASGRLFKKMLAAARLMEKEFAGDIKYAFWQLRADVRMAREQPSFRRIFLEYWVSVRRIFRRFVTTQSRDRHGMGPGLQPHPRRTKNRQPVRD